MCNNPCLLVSEQRLLTKVPVVNTVANERDVEKRVQEDSRLGNQDPGRPGSGEAQLLRYKVSFFSCFFFP